MTKRILLQVFAYILLLSAGSFAQGVAFDSLKANTGTNKALIYTPVTNYGHKIYSFDAGVRTDLRFAVRANTPVWTDAMSITSAGNVGVGLIAPSQKLTVNGNIMLGLGNYFGMALTDTFTYDTKTHPNYGMEWVNDSWSPQGPSLWASGFAGIKFFTNKLPRISINVDGNVGIGTITPGSYKLAVEGTLGARRIKVTQVLNWADFVFHPDYQLAPLQEVENYIRANRHLAGIPTTEEVQKEGVDLGEMNKLLLQKVEELTLYMIEEHKEKQKMQNQIDLLLSEVKEIKEAKNK
jgi:hypothetical protein